MSAVSALNDDIEKDVLPWLRLAEDLRMLQLEADLKMPQICVMGDQSSGKSSVLEALSGIPFPRGSGLVTRCPIRMVMKRARKDEMWSAIVSTTVEPEKKKTAKTVPELSRFTDEAMRGLCDGDSNFSPEGIVIELTSPEACDLTVVDLPGIIRTVTAGQSVRAIEQVNRLIKAYLMEERTIILAVIPANQDIATVDILERAQGVDPTGERTVGVLTKTDLIGAGGEDEVLAVVNNRRKPLALGYTMVKNRSQKEINDNVPTMKSRELELQFFENHPVFGSCNKNLYGIAQLSKKLTTLLVNRIKQELSPMKSVVERRLNEVRAQLRAMPRSYMPAKNIPDRQKLLVAATQDYVRHLTDCIRGEYWDRILVRHPYLRMYNMVLKKFESYQAMITGMAPQFRDSEFVTMLAVQIEQLRGRELPGFMSFQAFHMCMAQYIDQWLEPTTDLVQEVRGVALEVSVKLAEILFMQYPGFREALKRVTERVLERMANETVEKLRDVLSREKDPFTLNLFLPQWVNKLRHDRFVAALNTSFERSHTAAGPQNWDSLREEMFISMRHWYKSTHSVSSQASAQDMSEIMEAYWNLSSKRVVDNVCMISDSELLGKLPTCIQDEMYMAMRDDRKMEMYFVEDPYLAKNKVDAEQLRDRLMHAASKLNSIAVPVSTITPYKLPGQHQNAQSQQQRLPGDATTDTTANGSSTNAPSNQSQQQQQQNWQQYKGRELELQVRIGEHGIGLIIVHEHANNSIAVKGFRAMPGNTPNPAQAAGMEIGDQIVAINGTTLVDHNHAVNLIRAAKGTISVSIIRD